METYAESAARYYGGDTNDAANHPNLHGYWDSDPFGHDESGKRLPSETTEQQPMSANSIGNATMKEDGTIVLDLRAEAEDATVGIGQFVYAPNHPEYRRVLDHLGGLKPGEQKLVPPWPEG